MSNLKLDKADFQLHYIPFDLPVILYLALSVHTQCFLKCSSMANYKKRI